MKARGQLPHLFYPEPTMQRRQINSYAFPMDFDPLSLSPVLWLSDTGSSAGQWDDLSGNGKHLTQAVSADQPAIITGALNGRQVRRFDGTDKLSNSSFSGISGLSASSTFVVMSRQSSGMTGAVIVVSNNSLTTLGVSIQSWTGNLLYSSVSTVSHYGQFGYTSSDTSHRLVSDIYDGSLTGNSNRLKLRIDGTAVTGAYAGTIPATLPTLSLIDIGKSTHVTGNFVGDIAEVLIYPTALNGTDTASVEGYLIAKYAL